VESKPKLEKRSNMTEIRDIEQRRPGDAARAFGLLRRSDALMCALVVLGDKEEIDPEEKDAALEILEVMHEEACEQFVRARRDLGIPDSTA